MPKTKNVTVIPATLAMHTGRPMNTLVKRRVAGYARVSTDSEEQFTSYEAQIEYYTKLIKGHDGWQFVEVYTDEGISGTNTKHRDGFNRMIEDALAGRIDLIVTKSVSRFARNTVDSLVTVRKLKEKGVEVYFEKENIYTSTARVSCSSRSCPLWRRKNPAPFRRTSPGGSASDSQTAKSNCRTSALWAMPRVKTVSP